VSDYQTRTTKRQNLEKHEILLFSAFVLPGYFTGDHSRLDKVRKIFRRRTNEDCWCRPDALSVT